MSGEIGSMRPNPYIFDIENRKKRRPRLAHDLGAGAKCKKCGDKCPGFELHFWRKICMNCRCGKDDHDVEDDDEDIGQIVIGKLFDRPARTEKEELEYCYGNSLEIVNEETGKAENVKFDWVPPNIEKTLASRYMELLPADKRPIAGSEAAKARRRQLEQQIPLYDMDAAQRSDSLPPEELQNFQAYLERIRTQVAGQGTVQEIAGAPAPLLSQPLHWQTQAEVMARRPSGGDLDANGNIGYYPDTLSGNSIIGHGPLDQANIQNNNVGQEGIQNANMGQPDSWRSTKRPSLRQQFLGGMVGEPGGIPNFKSEDPAHSVPYGGTRMTAKPMQGLGTDKSVEGISSGISDLSVQNKLPGDIPGQKNIIPGIHPTQTGNQDQNLGQTGYSTNDQGQLPTPFGPKGYRPVRPAHLQLPNNQTIMLGKTGLPGSQPEQLGKGGFQPGQPGYQSEQSGKTTYLPGQPIYQSDEVASQPGHTDSLVAKPGYQPGQPGWQPGYQSEQPGQPRYQPGQPGYQPGQPEYQPGQPRYQPGQPGYQSGQPDQPGYQPGQPGYQPGQLGYQQRQPGQPGYRSDQPNYEYDQLGLQPGNQPDQFMQPQSQSGYESDKDFPPPPPDLLTYPSGQPRSDTASIDSGVEVYDNIGAKLRAKVDAEDMVPLLQMLARERNIGCVEATQAPYGAQLDTLTGGRLIAPGSDVTILFPGESQIIGSQAKTSGVRGNKSKYSCQGCSHPMNVGDVAIFCERAGEDKCWHPACFSCFTCKELLADLIYFYKDGKVFCGRHFTDAEEMPRCKSCDELIFGNSWTRADGFDWHIDHFCCNVCDTPMAGQRYVPDKNGYPYCLPCYMSYVAKMCEGCEEKISPEVNRCGHRGFFYHATPQCFKCYTCQETLLGKRFKMSKNWVFCSNECIQKVAEALANNPNPKMKEEV